MPMETANLLYTEAPRSNSTWGLAAGVIAGAAGCLAVMAITTAQPASNLWATTAAPVTATRTTMVPQYRPTALQAQAYRAADAEAVDAVPRVQENSLPVRATQGTLSLAPSTTFTLTALGAVVMAVFAAMWSRTRSTDSDMAMAAGAGFITSQQPGDDIERASATTARVPVGGRRSALLGGAMYLLGAGNASAVPMKDSGVQVEDSPMIQEMIRKSNENRERRTKELVDNYNRKNFKEYFEFEVGANWGRPETPAVKAAREWLAANK